MRNKDRHRISVRGCIEHEGNVLLIGFNDENGFHYNLPGGGVEAGEDLYAAVMREVWEEAGAAVVVKELLLTFEFVPELDDGTYGKDHRDLGLIFRCELKEGSRPRLPKTPDPNQVSVEWVSKEVFETVLLYPRVNQLLLQRLEAADLAGGFTRKV